MLGIESSGPHSNGYSLIRSVIKKHQAPKNFAGFAQANTSISCTCIRTNQENKCQRYGAYYWRRFDRKYIPRILKKGFVAKINLTIVEISKSF